MDDAEICYERTSGGKPVLKSSQHSAFSHNLGSKGEKDYERASGGKSVQIWTGSIRRH